MPETGGHLWTDNMQIPVGAPEAFTAQKFIDFVYRPEVQADIAEYVNYICPVNGVKEILAEARPGARREPAHLPGRRVPRGHVHLPRAGARGGARARRRVPAGHRRVATASQADAGATPKGGLPYLLLLPGLGWLAALLRDPAGHHGHRVAEDRDDRHRLPAHLGVLELHATRCRTTTSSSSARSSTPGSPRSLAFLIGYPLAYVIAFRGGRYRNALLLLVIVPFFVTYLIRTLSWETILSDSGSSLDVLRTVGLVAENGRAARHDGLGGGGHHLQLPAVHDPAALREPGADRRAACSRRATTSTAAGATCSCA